MCRFPGRHGTNNGAKANSQELMTLTLYSLKFVAATRSVPLASLLPAVAALMPFVMMALLPA